MGELLQPRGRSEPPESVALWMPVSHEDDTRKRYYEYWGVQQHIALHRDGIFDESEHMIMYDDNSRFAQVAIEIYNDAPDDETAQERITLALHAADARELESSEWARYIPIDRSA